MARWWSNRWAVLVLCAAPAAIGDSESRARRGADPEVIHGHDDREEQRDYPVDSALYRWAESSAMLIDRKELGSGDDGGFLLGARETFAESMSASGRPLCPDEPFQDEPILGGLCSAFLAAPDTMITAGHCVGAPDVCPHLAFVFGAGYDREARDPRRLGPDDVYFCERLVKLAASPRGRDFAVVKLDRPVVGRAPLRLRRTGKVADDEELVLIGNPLGLPTKIAAHGAVLDPTPEHVFKASTDSYGGGSGSAVLGARSGLVEGVLVRGEEDFVRRGDCWVSRIYPEGASACHGEEVCRATELAAFVP